MSTSPEPVSQGLTHGDSSPQDDRQRRTAARNRRAGLILFAIYMVFYAGFMAWNVVDPNGMARPVFLGVNLAIVYGFCLIVAALVLALVYVAICNRPLSGDRS